MQNIQRNEHYTDKGQYAIMTRIKVLDRSDLATASDRPENAGIAFNFTVVSLNKDLDRE